MAAISLTSVIQSGRLKNHREMERKERKEFNILTTNPFLFHKFFENILKAICADAERQKFSHPLDLRVTFHWENLISLFLRLQKFNLSTKPIRDLHI